MVSGSGVLRACAAALVAIACGACPRGAMASPADADAVPAEGAAANPAAGEAPDFDMFEIRVLGNSVLPAADVERAVYPHLGPKKTLADVELARDALVKAYRDRGFGTVLVDIPEQTVDEGIVRLAVTEGRVDRVTVKGARYFSGREIKAGVPAATSGTVPNIAELQKQLGDLARAAPDRRITPLLRAGRAPGQVDVQFAVDDRVPLHASLEANDRYTADTSRTRVNATLSYDYLFGRPDTFSVQYQTSPEERSEVDVLALTYLRRERDSANAWAFYFVDSNSDVAALGTLSVIGTGRIFGARRILALPSTPEFGGAVSLGVDYKDFVEDIRLKDSTSALTPIKYAVWSAGVNLFARKGAWSADGSLTLSAGLRGIANDEEEFAFKRARAHASFLGVRSQASVSRDLWLGFRATVRGSGQYSAAPLISNEQFSLGGVDTVRGYLEAESLVDRGAAGTIELATPAWRPIAARAWELRAATFLDAGVGSLEDALAGQDAHSKLRSYGAGLYLLGDGPLTAKIEWAKALVTAGRTRDGDSRVHFIVRSEF